jgi:glucosamine--fructose-6-phosphate aminotransferase (isomerizing)
MSNHFLSKKPFFIFLSQSGETADSREVLVNVNKHNWPSLTITNVDKSTLSREATYTELLYAGPEIAVASTKALHCPNCCRSYSCSSIGCLHG